MITTRLSLVVAALSALTLSVPAQNCANTSVGFTPLNDLGAGTYLGFQGGLYPGGSNAVPAAHLAKGLSEVSQVVPRNAAGAPDPTGAIVFISIGMSNARQEFEQFVTLSDADPLRAPEVTVLNLAQGGMAAEDMDSPSDGYWVGVQNQLANQGLTPQQVQVVWLKNANRAPTASFPMHAENLQSQFASIVQIIRDVFPNARVCYGMSRIYAGYATTALNPEPFAYESGYSMKWLIEQQISGDPALNFDPAEGPVEAPWLQWGPYMWADGLTPRSDGLTWACSDFAPDGTHPGIDGRLKVAQALLDFLHTDATGSWYLGAASGTPSFCDAGDGSLASCPCGNPGLASSGCEIAQTTGGVQLDLVSQETTPLNRVTFLGSGFPATTNPTSIVIRSSALTASPVAFGDGLRCVAAPVVRLAATFASGGTALHTFGHSPAAGVGDFHYQAWFRNTPAMFCTPDAFNLSNGRTLQW